MKLPPKYAVRDYLKRQGAKLEAFSSDITGTVLDRFQSAYSHRRVDAACLKSLAEEYRSYLADAGCFGLATSYTAPTKVSPHRERSTVSGYALEPIGLGQGIMGAGMKPYVENSALLRTHVGEFRRKKATLGQGFGGVVLTQHLLERVYERMEIDRTDLGPLIEKELGALLRALAIANIANLWIDHIAQDVGGYRFTAVPYSNGLMLANQRILFGTYTDGDFGFRLEIPSGRIETPFLNNDWVIDDLGSKGFLRGDNRPVMIVCGVTYMNALTLNDDEADYFYAFQALLDEIGDDALNGLTYFEFAPTLSHQRHPSFDLKAHFGPKLSRLEKLLKAGWLHPKITRPLCLLLPYDYEIKTT